MSIAIVTGGSRGFGRAVAEDLAAHGWEVIIDGRRRDVLEGASRSLGERVHPVQGDIADSGHRAALVVTAERLGGLDLLVNNAGTLGPAPLPRLRDVDPAVLVEVFAVNVAAQLALIQEALALLEASGGAVVNVTSDAAVEAYPRWGVYGSSKAALDLLSRVLAAEEDSLKVWSLDPGDLRTEMHQAAFAGEDISDCPLPESVAPVIRQLVELDPPSGRLRAGELAR